MLLCRMTVISYQIQYFASWHKGVRPLCVTKKMFMKDKRSRKAFYDKLGKGVCFSLAKDEQFFVDDEGESEDSQS